MVACGANSLVHSLASASVLDPFSHRDQLLILDVCIRRQRQQ